MVACYVMLRLSKFNLKHLRLVLSSHFDPTKEVAFHLTNS